MGIIRVGGQLAKGTLSYFRKHPIIVHGKHPIAQFIIQSEHKQLLHANPNLLIASISSKYIFSILEELPDLYLEIVSSVKDIRAKLCHSSKDNYRWNV